MPRLGKIYDIEIEIISKPIEKYNTDAYFELDLPVAPAVMVGEEIMVEGSDIPEETIESAICKHLDLPPPGPPKKGILGRFFYR